MRRRERERGFTLIEVLVALVILGLVMGACYRLLSTGMRSITEADGLFRAVLLAESAAAEVGLRVDPRAAAGERSADGYRLSVAVVPYDDPEVPAAAETGLRLYRVTVTVAWSGQRSYRLATLALGPAT